MVFDKLVRQAVLCPPPSALLFEHAFCRRRWIKAAEQPQGWKSFTDRAMKEHSSGVKAGITSISLLFFFFFFLSPVSLSGTSLLPLMLLLLLLALESAKDARHRSLRGGTGKISGISWMQWSRQIALSELFILNICSTSCRTLSRDTLKQRSKRDHEKGEEMREEERRGEVRRPVEINMNETIGEKRRKG